MVGHQWSRPICSAWAKSRNRQCRARVGRRPDGSFFRVCRVHGAATPPYSERPIGPEGKERIAAAMRSYWAKVRSGEVIRPTRKSEPAVKFAPWRCLENARGTQGTASKGPSGEISGQGVGLILQNLTFSQRPRLTCIFKALQFANVICDTGGENGHCRICQSLDAGSGPDRTA